MELFYKCPQCSGQTISKIKQVVGSLVKVEQECGFCNSHCVWHSQPYVGSIPAGNLLISCGKLLTGSLPTKSIRMLRQINIAMISHETFLLHQRHFIQPAISEVWNIYRSSYMEVVAHSQEGICLGRDGRADTPGHSVKYGNYSMMDLDKGAIVDVQLVQVGLLS